MSAHPTASAALHELEQLFPDKQIELLTSQMEMAQLPDVVNRLRHCRGGGIVALFTVVPEVVIFRRLRLSRMRMDGVTETDIIPVDEGTLVVGMVKSRVPPKRLQTPKRSSRVPRRVDEPARPEMEVVEGADLRELDLEAIIRRGRGGRWSRTLSAAQRSELFDVIGDLGIAKVAEEQARPTVAGMLAYGHRPDLWLEGARAVVTVDGVERVFAGSIKRIVGEALRWNPLVQRIGAGLVGPALVNALVHRDWSETSRGLPVEVAREGDCIEIRNPGSLVSGWSRGKSRPNPIVYGLLRRQGLAGKRGRGLDAVVRGLERLGARPFGLVGRDGQVRFVMEMPWQRESLIQEETREDVVSAPAATPTEVDFPEQMVPPAAALPSPPVVICPMAAKESVPDPTARLSEPCLSRLSPPKVAARTRRPATTRQSLAERHAEVLDLLCSQGELTTREIIEELGWTRSTTRAVIAALVEDGQVERCVDAARSPSQRYRAIQ